MKNNKYGKEIKSYLSNFGLALISPLLLVPFFLSVLESDRTMRIREHQYYVLLVYLNEEVNSRNKTTAVQCCHSCR